MLNRTRPWYRAIISRISAGIPPRHRMVNRRLRVRTSFPLLTAEVLEVRQLLSVTFAPQLSTNVANYTGTLPLAGEVHNNPTVNVILWGPNWSTSDQATAVAEVKAALEQHLLAGVR